MQDLGGWQDDHAEKDLEKVKEVVDKIRLPAIVCLSMSFWDDASNGTEDAKLDFFLRQL